MAKKLTYFDFEAKLGITKHVGGGKSTRQLLKICKLQKGKYILDIGCGIGITPVFLAKKFDCKVMAIDKSPEMLEWAKKRATKEGVADKIEFKQADAQKLPFPNDTFDIVISESVTNFVEDKLEAIKEYQRVTKPGGHVGLNEVLWVEPPPQHIKSYLEKSTGIGQNIPNLLNWKELLVQSGLEDIFVKSSKLDVLEQITDQMKWMGFDTTVKAWGRMIKLLFTDSDFRTYVFELLPAPLDISFYLGYCLLVGRKPSKPL